MSKTKALMTWHAPCLVYSMTNATETVEVTTFPWSTCPACDGDGNETYKVKNYGLASRKCRCCKGFGICDETETREWLRVTCDSFDSIVID